MKKRKNVFCSPIPMKEGTFSEVTHIDENGIENHLGTFTSVDPCSKDYNRNIPTRSEYTMENLLKAGVPLDQVSVGNLLDSTDQSVIDSQAMNLINSVNSNKV